MTRFEEELRQALKRQEPGPDFTARVLARCGAEIAKTQVRWWQPVWGAPGWRLAAVAATLLVVAGGTAYEQHDREIRGMAAKRKLLLAVHIAGTKLQEVQQRVAESTEEQ